MADLLGAASAIMRSSERTIAIVANNVANVSTPGFRRQVSYVDVTSSLNPSERDLPVIATRTDDREGHLQQTGAPLDLAVSGPGYFQLRSGEMTVYSRQGQFHRLEDGRIANAQGYVVQQAGGGDLVLDGDSAEILADGTVVEDERPVGRIALFTPGEEAQLEALTGSIFALTGTAEEVEDPHLRQGMVEASNVTLGDEMVTMMAAMRQAEGGARLAMLYDELTGRAIQTLGQAR
jgi:flagellar basal-body rod protein FlgF